MKEKKTDVIASLDKDEEIKAMLGLQPEPQANGSTIFREENVKKQKF